MSGLLGTAFRLLDLGFFRIGGEEYADDNGSYGLATLEKRHAHIEDRSIVFEYPAKSGQERLVAVADDARAGGGDRPAPTPGRRTRVARLSGGPPVARRLVQRHQQLPQVDHRR